MIDKQPDPFMTQSQLLKYAGDVQKSNRGTRWLIGGLILAVILLIWVSVMPSAPERTLSQLPTDEGSNVEAERRLNRTGQGQSGGSLTATPSIMLFFGLTITGLLLLGLRSTSNHHRTLLKVYNQELSVRRDLTRLIDTANAPIFGVDNKGNINEWNQAAVGITGFSRKNVLGNNLVEDLIPDDFKASVKAVLENALEGEETSNFDFPLFTKTGKQIRVLLNATARRDASGDVIGVIGIGQDITELIKYRESLEKEVAARTHDLKTALAEAAQARDNTDAILKSMADGLIVIDANNHVVQMNPAAEGLLGVPLSKAFGQPIEFSIDDETLRERVVGTLEKQLEGYTFDFEMPGGQEGHPGIIRARTNIVKSTSGETRGIIITMYDVSHEREVDRMKTEFISTAAHELRTPLTSIQGFSEILLTRPNLDAEESNKFLKYINSMSVRLGKVIGDLLDIARLESGQSFSMEKEICNASTSIAQIVPMYMDHHKDHTFELELPSNPVPVLVDKAKMQQVLENLLSNAVKYSPGGGNVRVVGEVREKEFTVSISDTGMGMTPEQVENVFAKFYRADSTNTAIEGTGLGMAIVKHIVEAHGGRTWVESELGQGTTVTFTLPIQDETIVEEV